jgi:uncharacterized protein YggE
MNRWKGLIAMAGLAAALTLGVACANGEAATAPQPQQPAANVQTSAPEAPAPAMGAPVSQPAMPVSVPERTTATSGMASMPAVTGYPVMQAVNSQTGIWVTGEGRIMVDPDLAILNVGVESFGSTVAEANQKAAAAMDAIVQVLRNRGLADEDIQTTSFNIYPQYDYREVVEDGMRRGEQVLTGYTVSNSAVIKIRDLDAVGQIIDEVATAGGNDTRIHGINFTVEDPRPLMRQLREQAVNDARAKAQHFAELTGVTLGNLVFISEGGATVPVARNFDMRGVAFAEAAQPAPPTPIISGETELTLYVQAVFAIQ